MNKKVAGLLVRNEREIYNRKETGYTGGSHYPLYGSLDSNTNELNRKATIPTNRFVYLASLNVVSLNVLATRRFNGRGPRILPDLRLVTSIFIDFLINWHLAMSPPTMLSSSAYTNQSRCAKTLVIVTHKEPRESTRRPSKHRSRS